MMHILPPNRQVDKKTHTGPDFLVFYPPNRKAEQNKIIDELTFLKIADIRQARTRIPIDSV